MTNMFKNRVLSFFIKLLIQGRVKIRNVMFQILGVEMKWMRILYFRIEFFQYFF